MIEILKNIIIGWFNLIFRSPNKLAKDRLAICKKCDYNENGWCGWCGCYLKAKVRVKDEECHFNKWPNVNDYECKRNNE